MRYNGKYSKIYGVLQHIFLHFHRIESSLRGMPIKTRISHDINRQFIVEIFLFLL
uniref:Uncharacterized protein n=1 Tax=Ascaris lumbricoides TaxID=6252 RepID=A0A0M3I657_ASCLU